MVQVRIQRLDRGIEPPVYAYPGDAGCDVRSSIDVVLAPGERALVPTGIALALPEGYACFVHPRSGLAAKHGVSLVNTPGTIDSGYRGEIKISIINHDLSDPFIIARGDRIAQLVFQRFEHADFIEVEDITDDADRAAGESHRGARGHGSSGVTEIRSTDGNLPA